MTHLMKSCFITLALLFLGRVEEGAEAAYPCPCPVSPPLQALCNSGFVIRAYVTGKEEVDSGTLISTTYHIDVIKVFKGHVGVGVNAVYSPMECTANLQTDGAQYLITGSLAADGTMHIISCNYISLWYDLSAAELRLLQSYPNSCKH